MPLLKTAFNASFPFKNPHVSTIHRALLLKETPHYTRKRITTWDNDFIDLDFSFVKSKTITILIHGLEGSSTSNYIVTTANYLNLQGIDAVAVNLRGCSGEDNLQLGTYHSGKTDDLHFVIEHLIKNYHYTHITICGFSLGGNITLKYLGEYANQIPKEVKGGVAISVPVDLTSSQKALQQFNNKLYLTEFLKSIKLKILNKAEKHANFNPDKKTILTATKLSQLEAIYTVPVYGFDSPRDYWIKASSKPFISNIKLPTLLINAKDDTFLGDKCYPIDEALNSDYFHLATPKYGGHVGFISSLTSENKWLEQQIVDFILHKIKITN